MSDLLVEYSNPAFPLVVTLVKNGGLTGASPVVALRDGATLNSYLDWSDDTFKTSGWTLKNALLTEIGAGQYQRLLDLSAIPGLTYGQALVAEFSVTDGGALWTGHDVLLLIDTGTNVELLRKMVTNRFEETPGNPGIAVLFDDDGVTPLLSWQLRDASGNAVLSNVGAPAKRSAAT